MRADQGVNVAKSKTQEVIDDITEQIESGRLGPGDRLPSTAELRAQYGVSITVVRNAVQWLKAKGLVEGLSGVGVFVAEQDDSPDA
ncbi:winged helix-turn-helix transcriptional regulator [Actinoplanes sp. TBRC 11911]|nr:winged helix-turn-helix transcriptional regulator [Actinoplanes sp. TBRC 11911]